eukprot:6174371-Pleurochrysis_carterae.AAC.2
MEIATAAERRSTRLRSRRRFESSFSHREGTAIAAGARARLRQAILYTKDSLVLLHACMHFRIGYCCIFT